jgi:hypothetical protein
VSGLPEVQFLFNTTALFMQFVGYTHNFFDYLDDVQTRYILDARHWVRLDEAPIQLSED